MAEDILGISAHFDLQDIEGSFKKMCDELTNVGAITEAVSKNMQAAVAGIGLATDEAMREKAVGALQTLMSYLSQVKNSAETNIEKTTATIDKLREAILTLEFKRAEVPVGDQIYQEYSTMLMQLNEQMDAQKDRLEKVRGEADLLNNAYESLSATMQSITSAEPPEAIKVEEDIPVRLEDISQSLANLRDNAAEAFMNAQELGEALASSKEQLKALHDIHQDSKLLEKFDALAAKANELGETFYNMATGKIDFSSGIKELDELEAKISAFSEETGLSFDSMQEKIAEVRQAFADFSEGDISYDEVREKLEGLYSAWNENADRLSLDGIKENVAELGAIAQETASVSQGAIDAQKAYIDGLTEKINELVQKSHELAEQGDAEGVQKIDKEIIELTNNLKVANENLSIMSESFREANEKANEASEALDKFADAEKQEKINALKGIWGGLKDAIHDTIKAEKEATEESGAFKKAIDMLPGPVKKAVKGIQLMTGAARAFMATGLGMVIGAIVIALQALFTWFKKSADGQRVFAKLSAYVGVILQALTEIVVKLGDFLYHAFADANGPMHDFAVTLGKTVVTAIKAVYHNIKGLATGIKGVWDILHGDVGIGWSEIQEGAKLVSQAWVETGKAVASGVKAIGYQIEGAGKMWSSVFQNVSFESFESGVHNLLNNLSLSGKLAGDELKLEDDILDTKIGQAKLQDEINQKKEEIKKLNGEEREKALQQLLRLQNSEYDKQIDLAKRALDIKQKRNSMHTKTLENLREEKLLQANITKLEVQKSAAERAARLLNSKEKEKEDKAQAREEARAKKAEERQQKAAARQAKQADAQAKRDARAAQREATRERKISEAEANASHKYNELVRGQIQERIEEQTQIESQLADARIAAMKDGSKKVRAQKALEHKREIDQIVDQMNDAVKKERERQIAEFNAAQAIIKARGGSVKTWDDKVNLDKTEINRITKSYRELVELTQANQEQDVYNELISKYKDYTSARLEIEQKYNADIEELEQLRANAIAANDKQRVEALTLAIAKAERERGKALIDASVKQIKETPEYEAAYSDLNNATHDTIDKLIAEYKRAEKEAEKAGLPTQAIRQEVEKLQDLLVQDTPFVALQNAVTEAQNAEVAFSRARDILAGIQQGRQLIRGWKRNGLTMEPIMWTEEDAKAEVEQRGQEVNKTADKTAEAAKKAIQSTQRLQMSIRDLGEAIGGTAGQIIGMIGNVASYATQGITTIIDSAQAAQKATDIWGKAINTANMWLAAISTMMQVIGAVQKLLPTSDDLYEKAAQKQAEINGLARAVNEYRLAVIASQQAERNWFKTDGLSSLTDAYERHGEVVKAYYEEMYAAQEKYKNKSAGISKALPIVAGLAAVAATVFTGGAAGVAILGSTLATALGTAAGAVGAAVIGSITGIATAATQAAISKITYSGNQVAAVDNLRMQTRHKTFFRSEKTQDLRQWVKENMGADLFDEEGLINLEAARTVLDKYGDKLVGETKETLERLVKLREQYDEFMDEIKEYVSNLYSPLVDNMTDALFEWLATGRDVLSQFKASAQQTFADVAKDMVRQMVINSIFDSYKDQLKDIYATYAVMSKNQSQAVANDYLVKSVMTATDSFMNTAEQQIPVLQDAIQRIDEQFRERGWDITGTNFGEESASYKSASGFTYDQANEMNGRLAALQIGVEMGNAQRMQMLEAFEPITFNLSELTVNAGRISDNMEQIVVMQFDSLSRLTEIRDNTAVLPEMATNIQEMRDDIRNKL